MFKNFITSIVALSVSCTTAHAQTPPSNAAKKNSQSFFEKFQTLRHSFKEPTEDEKKQIKSDHIPVDYDVEYVPLAVTEEEHTAAVFIPTANEEFAQATPPLTPPDVTAPANNSVLPSTLPQGTPAEQQTPATTSQSAPTVLNPAETPIPKITMPKLYLKDLVASEAKKKEEIPSIYYNKKNPGSKSPSSDTAEPPATPAESRKDYEQPQKRPSSGYRNQRLPALINQKEYSKENAHLPKAYYVNEYRQILFDSAASGRTDVLRTLIEYFDNVDVRDDQGNTPLLYATMAGNANSVRSLLFMDADANAKNYRGTTPLYAAVYAGRPDLTAMLLEHGADPSEISSDNQSLLILASSLKNKAIVDQLFDHTPNINVNSRMANGDTALHVAVKQQSLPVVQTLLERGANPNERNQKGHTPLMLAAYAGNAPIVTMLLQFGADPDEINDNGYNATQVAAARGFNNIAAIVQNKSIELGLNGRASLSNQPIATTELAPLPKKAAPAKKPVNKKPAPAKKAVTPKTPAKVEAPTEATPAPAAAAATPTETPAAPVTTPETASPVADPTPATVPPATPEAITPPASNETPAPVAPAVPEVPADVTPITPVTPTTPADSSLIPPAAPLQTSIPDAAAETTIPSTPPSDDPKALLRYHLDRMLHPGTVAPATSVPETPVPQTPSETSPPAPAEVTPPVTPVVETPAEPAVTPPPAEVAPAVETTPPATTESNDSSILDDDSLPPLPSLE